MRSDPPNPPEETDAACHVCGAVGDLTFEHLPPRSTGNRHRTELVDIQAWLRPEEHGSEEKGRISQKGAGAETLCEECNNRSGRLYVPELRRWVRVGNAALAELDTARFDAQVEPTYVELEIGARAGAHALVSACASGAEAIGYAVEMIRSGRADVVVAGGTEAAIHPMPLAAFAASRTLSTRNDDPATASRPYDLHRDGFVLGEGAGIVVLESAEHAAARGARVYARLAGVGLSSDGYHITSPDPEGRGQVAAMRSALTDAQLTASDIGSYRQREVTSAATTPTRPMATTPKSAQITSCPLR